MYFGNCFCIYGWWCTTNRQNDDLGKLKHFEVLKIQRRYLCEETVDLISHYQKPRFYSYLPDFMVTRTWYTKEGFFQ